MCWCGGKDEKRCNNMAHSEISYILQRLSIHCKTLLKEEKLALISVMHDAYAGKYDPVKSINFEIKKDRATGSVEVQGFDSSSWEYIITAWYNDPGIINMWNIKPYNEDPLNNIGIKHLN